MTRRPRTDALRRRPPRVEPRGRILIVCEGAVTEPGYFGGLRQDLRAAPVTIVINNESGVPKTLVERAVELKKDAEIRAKRERDPYLRYDQVWCVFDVDAHPNLPEALQQAKANHIHIALSNPCFELWVLLHFQDQRAHLERAAAAHACRRHLPRYEKAIPYEALRSRYAEALQRARDLAAWQKTRGNTGANPSTDVYLLTEVLQALGKKRLLDAHRR
jgi:hypothetical protein